MTYRFDRKKALYSFLFPALIYGSIILVLLYLIYPELYLLKNGVIISLSIFAFWRYGWMITNNIRAFIYGYFYYPYLKRRAEKVSEDHKFPQNIYFMIPSYQEDFWVTIESFRSVLSEISEIPSSVTIVVATSGEKEDAVILNMFKAHRKRADTKLIFQHQVAGKRIAMGHALRTIAREYHTKKFSDPNSVTIFMDGDSYMEKGFLRKIIPFFVSEYRLGALTTNEAAYIESKNRWYKEWFNLKFGQRHILFQAHALSRKVMTLTGRLSAYRTSIVVRDDFISLVENDIITDPVHGKFRFLMGDDKSTWFYLLKNGWDMLYIPDALCISLESRDGSFLELSRSLPYRWFGNTLRNNNRALKLGPRKLGWYIWYAVLDQRLIMWTSLVGISSALILGVFISPYYPLFFIIWVIFIRLIQLFIIALGGHHVSWRMLLLILYTQWIGALIKIKAFYNLSDQRWSKNGDEQKTDKDRVHIRHPLVPLLPRIMMFSSISFFITVLLVSHGVLRIPEQAFFASWADALPLVNSIRLNAAQNKTEGKRKNYTRVVDLHALGVKPGVKNTAHIINRILRESDPDCALVLQFDEGIYPLYEPIVIDRDNVTLKGAGKDKTLLQSHLRTRDEAVIKVLGKRGKRIGYLAKNLYQNQSALVCRTKKKPGKYLLVRQPNDPLFVRSTGARKWYRKYPYLRQEIVEVLDYDPLKHKIYTKKPLLTDYEAQKTEVIAVDMVENVSLQNFTLQQINDDKNINRYRNVFENSFKNIAVDALLFEYSAHCSASFLNIMQSGSHPLNCTYSYGLLFEHLYIDGSWNKGKKGNGYVRFARTYYSVFRQSKVKNIRHITLQWSASGNHIYQIDSGVDINLHGGYAHQNRIDYIDFNIPHKHRWEPVELCPVNARWAPPDGKNDIRYKTFRYAQGSKKL